MKGEPMDRMRMIPGDAEAEAASQPRPTVTPGMLRIVAAGNRGRFGNTTLAETLDNAAATMDAYESRIARLERELERERSDAWEALDGTNVKEQRQRGNYWNARCLRSEARILELEDVLSKFLAAHKAVFEGHGYIEDMEAAQRAAENCLARYADETVAKEQHDTP